MRYLHLLLALALPAAAADVRLVEEIIAKINGEIVTRSELERDLAEYQAEMARQNLGGEKLKQALAERQKEALRELIDQSLLIQRGKELGLSVETQIIKYMDDLRRQYNIGSMEEFEKWIAEKAGMAYEDFKERIRNQILTQRVIGQEVGSRISVPKEEIQKYYEEHKAEFVRPEQVHLREIFLNIEGKDPKEIPAIEKKANDLLARLKKGERFAEIAAKNSDSESAKQGGDIGFFKRGVLDKEIEDLVFRMRRGQNTELLKRKNGFLILRLEDRHQEGQATLQDVEQEITERLYMPRMQPALREYLTRLRQNAFIEIRPGYTDSGAAPGMDTTWKDPENFKPAVTTKAEATKKKRRLLWVIPRGGSKPEAGPAGSSEQKPPAPKQATP
jgi:parvulin-like peptidyl-prolyl isomerase